MRAPYVAAHHPSRHAGSSIKFHYPVSVCVSDNVRLQLMAHHMNLIKFILMRLMR